MTLVLLLVASEWNGGEHTFVTIVLGHPLATPLCRTLSALRAELQKQRWQRPALSLPKSLCTRLGFAMWVVLVKFPPWSHSDSGLLLGRVTIVLPRICRQAGLLRVAMAARMPVM